MTEIVAVAVVTVVGRIKVAASRTDWDGIAAFENSFLPSSKPASLSVDHLLQYSTDLFRNIELIL